MLVFVPDLNIIVVVLAYTHSKPRVYNQRTQQHQLHSSEEEFGVALRSGLILCYVINKVEPGVMAKVVEGSCDSTNVPDRVALSIHQCFENVRNFLVTVEQMGLSTFDTSDLEQVGVQIV